VKRSRWYCTNRQAQRYERKRLVCCAGGVFRFSRGRNLNKHLFYDCEENAWCVPGTRIPRSLRKYFGGRVRV
jgi:hypothetical protein